MVYLLINWYNTCGFLKAKFYTDEVFSFQVIQRYYVQYLSGYDAVALNQCIQNLHNLTDDESILLSSIWQSISHLTVEQVEDPEHTFDFRYPTFLIRRLISMLSVYKKITNEHYVILIELASCASVPLSN